MKVIDLSKPIRFNRGDPRFMQVRVRHKPRYTAKLLVWLLGLPRRLFPKDFGRMGRRHHHQDGRALDDAYRCAVALRADVRTASPRRPSTRCRWRSASAPASCST